MLVADDPSLLVEDVPSFFDSVLLFVLSLLEDDAEVSERERGLVRLRRVDVLPRSHFSL